MSDETNAKEAVERARAAQRLANDYKALFSSDAGKRVLADLSKRFGLDKPAFLPKHEGGYDPLWAAIRDGQRQVLLYIDFQRSLPDLGDGDISQPKTKIVKDHGET